MMISSRKESKYNLFFLYFMIIPALFPAIAYSADIKAASEAARVVCEQVHESGEYHSDRMKGEIRGEIAGFFKKILPHIGITGMADMTSTTWEGLKQEALPAARNEVMNCRLKALEIFGKFYRNQGNLDEEDRINEKSVGKNPAPNEPEHQIDQEDQKRSSSQFPKIEGPIGVLVQGGSDNKITDSYFEGLGAAIVAKDTKNLQTERNVFTQNGIPSQKYVPTKEFSVVSNEELCKHAVIFAGRAKKFEEIYQNKMNQVARMEYYDKTMGGNVSKEKKDIYWNAMTKASDDVRAQEREEFKNEFLPTLREIKYELIERLRTSVPEQDRDQNAAIDFGICGYPRLSKAAMYIEKLAESLCKSTGE